MRIINRYGPNKLVEKLKMEYFGLTIVNAEGSKGNVKIIFTVVNRQNIQKIIRIVKKYNPKVFYSIEDIRYISKTLPSHIKPWYRKKFKSLFSWRKGK